MEVLGNVLDLLVEDNPIDLVYVTQVTHDQEMVHLLSSFSLDLQALDPVRFNSSIRFEVILIKLAAEDEKGE